MAGLEDVALLPLPLPFLIATSLLLSVLLGWLLLNATSTKKSEAAMATAKKKAATRSTATGPKELGTFTVEEVAQHNKESDCWLIIKGKVYDVTDYIMMHPGGDAIMNNAGRDSTEGFYGPQHQSAAFQTMEEYQIGTLKDS